MSEDSNVYLKDEEFPMDIWEEIIGLFPSSLKSENSWVVDAKDGPLWLDVTEMKPSNIYSDIYNWKIGIHYSSPYGPHKLWTAFSIPYHCLSFMDNAVFHCPNGENRFSTAEEIHAFATKYLSKRTSLQKMAKYGLLDSNENVALSS